MTAGPYRTADPSLERFGPVVSQHGHSRLAILRSIAVVVGLSLFGLSVCASVAGQVDDLQPNHLVGGIVASLGACFGRFAVTREWLADGDRRLTWKEVGGAALVEGNLVIGDATRGIRILPKRDGILAWAHQPYDDVPNAAVLVAVLERLRGGEPG